MEFTIKNANWLPVPLKGTGDYKLLLAGSHHYVYRIRKGNAEMRPFGRHPISDSLGLATSETSNGFGLDTGPIYVSTVNCFYFNSMTGINEL